MPAQARAQALPSAPMVALPTPQSGTWMVKAEANGQPGRGLVIDVQDGMLQLHVSHYEASGEATFHVATGPLQADANGLDSTMTAPLQQWQDGRHLAGPPQPAELADEAGDVTLQFSSASQGVVQFPGEAPVAIERALFDQRQRPENQQTSDEFAGHLHGVHGPDDLFAGSAFRLSLVREPYSGQTQAIFSATNEFIPIPLPCVADASDAERIGRAWICGRHEPATGSATLRLRLHGNEVVGEIQYARVNAGGVPGAAGSAQLRGSRHYYSATDNWSRQSQHYAHSAANPQYLVPRSGLWVLADEHAQSPGRSIAIDVEGDTLVMQLYHYTEDGHPTFDIAATPFVPGAVNQATLYHYQGGRYFGSEPRIAELAGISGEVAVSFDSMSSGTIALPGEAPQRIVRLPMSGPPDLHTLRGLWRFSTGPLDGLTVTLEHIGEGYIESDDGLFRCTFIQDAGGHTDGRTVCTQYLQRGDANAAEPVGVRQFSFQWEPGLTSVYGQQLNPLQGSQQGAGISRIAMPGRTDAGTYFSVGSRITLPLRNPN